MTTINAVTFSQNGPEGDITSQISHISRSIDRLMTQLISVKTGAGSDGSQQEQQRIESQIRQLQTQKSQMEHRKTDVEAQQKQQESLQVRASDSESTEGIGRKKGIYV